MKLFNKASEILKTDEFSRKRCLAARKLYHMAKGEEKEMIGQLFESQAVMAKDPKDWLWLNRIDDNFS